MHIEAGMRCEEGDGRTGVYGVDGEKLGWGWRVFKVEVMGSSNVARERRRKSMGYERWLATREK